MIVSIIIGLLLSTLGFLYSLISTKRTLKKNSWEDFIKSYWLNVIIKFGILLVSILIMIFLFEIEKKAFLLSFFISYLFFLIIEVFYLNKMKNFRNFATEKNNKVK